MGAAYRWTVFPEETIENRQADIILCFTQDDGRKVST